MSLNAADLLLRRAEGAPAAHLTAAADQLLEHLAAIERTTVPDQGILAVLARAGAQLLVSGIELDGACDAAQRLRGAKSPKCRRRPGGGSPAPTCREPPNSRQGRRPSAAGSDGTWSRYFSNPGSATATARQCSDRGSMTSKWPAP